MNWKYWNLPLSIKNRQESRTSASFLREQKASSKRGSFPELLCDTLDRNSSDFYRYSPRNTGELKRKLATHLVAVVGPGGPLEQAALLVEGEVLHVDVAAAAEDAVAQPDHLARVAHDHVRVDHRRAVLRICAGGVGLFARAALFHG